MSGPTAVLFTAALTSDKPDVRSPLRWNSAFNNSLDWMGKEEGNTSICRSRLWSRRLDKLQPRWPLFFKFRGCGPPRPWWDKPFLRNQEHFKVTTRSTENKINTFVLNRAEKIQPALLAAIQAGEKTDGIPQQVGKKTVLEGLIKYFRSLLSSVLSALSLTSNQPCPCQ